jgi:DNA-binding NtrC family response regulator
MIKRIVILQDEQLVVREISARQQAMAAPKLTPAPAPDEPTADVAPMEPAAELPSSPRGRLPDVAKAAAIAAERAIITDTLRSVQWNRRRAADQLGVSYKTLLTKIKECGVAP